MERIFRATNAAGLIGREAMVVGVTKILVPHLPVTRDKQWGRSLINWTCYARGLCSTQFARLVSFEVGPYWQLTFAHVHVVAEGFSDPDRTITDLKAYASRALRRQDSGAAHSTYWARGGSTRRLCTLDAVNAAIKYVADQQGEAMAVYVIPLLTRGATGAR